MAGYRVPRRTAVITFDGTDYDGAEVECKLDVPLGLYFDFGRVGEESREQESLFRRWGDEVLLAWNLEDDDGRPLPATGEGIMALPPFMVTLLLNKWTETVVAVPSPLGGRSNGGAQSAALMPATAR
jgi:hypothetical protein